MGKKKRIIIGISFNSKKLKGRKQSRFSRRWINNRMNIFMKYTLNSLKRQTNQRFITLLSYADKSKPVIKTALKRYRKLPGNIRFIKNSENEKEIKNRSKGYKYLYLVRLDSDDLYRKSFINRLYHYRHKKKTAALINQHGYMYDSKRKRIAPMYAKSPAFYTLIYKAKDYLKGKRHRLRGGHPSAIKLRHEKLKGRNYVHIIHSGNTTSKFRSKRNKVINNRKIITSRRNVKKILHSYK